MLTHFKDASGMDWAQAMGILRVLRKWCYRRAGENNPSFTDDPIHRTFSASGLVVPGSATANYFLTTYGTYAATISMV